MIPTTGRESHFEQGGDTTSSFHQYANTNNNSKARNDGPEDIRDEIRFYRMAKQALKKDAKQRNVKSRGKATNSTKAVVLNKYSKSYQSQVNLRQKSIRRTN